MRKEEKGFTLIELMVVVVIIGVLAAVAVPKISGIVGQSKVNADIASGKTLQDAVDRYQQNTNGFPADLGTLVPTYIAKVPTIQQDGTAAGTGLITYDSATGAVTVYKGSVAAANQVWP